MAENDPLKSDILQVLGTDLSSVGAECVIGGVLSGNLVGQLIAGVECQDLRDMDGDGRDNDVCIILMGTDIVRVVFEGVDGVLDEVEGLGLGLVGLPVAGNHALVPGEGVQQTCGFEHACKDIITSSTS